nr:hypothetical protein [Tanacetum cinerariifolium]
ESGGDGEHGLDEEEAIFIVLVLENQLLSVSLLICLGKHDRVERIPSDSGANERPPMLERGNYIPWESRFRRFLNNKLEEGERMWNSIQNGPYERPMIPDLDGTMNINGTIITPSNLWYAVEY